MATSVRIALWVRRISRLVENFQYFMSEALSLLVIIMAWKRVSTTPLLHTAKDSGPVKRVIQNMMGLVLGDQSY